MEYICPHCGKSVSCKWWGVKRLLKCSNCHQHIFASIKIKLNILNFVGGFTGVLITPMIIIFTELAIWKKLLLVLLASFVLCSIVQVIELKICHEANVKVENR
ncbi:hypothetical protein [Oceanirhabdus seepicola]|uniref:Uncharacterized protein n=1 Tax=Oceanirhabdus seepicola TaxID=2828781 RepID=A0A9J6P4W7_9CLOT|nr:hypothetical protein [Oceanirhabdus seepicola]MCM1991182.1 hypothetical protein [Oceanirhabdus seepicola]